MRIFFECSSRKGGRIQTHHSIVNREQVVDYVSGETITACANLNCGKMPIVVGAFRMKKRNLLFVLLIVVYFLSRNIDTSFVNSCITRMFLGDVLRCFGDASIRGT